MVSLLHQFIVYMIFYTISYESHQFFKGAYDIVPFLLSTRSLQAFFDSEGYPVRLPCQDNP
jgi:hypothetical protein